jgi:hypothetical protein
MCLADTEISQKKREECLSNALDVLATIDPILANKYSAARFVCFRFRVINKRANWNAVVQTSRFSAYGISLCVSIFVIIMYYVNRDPRGIMFLGSAFLLHK